MCEWAPRNRLTRIDWLIERNNPSVRYFALVDLLEVAPDDPEALATRQAIMENGPVPAILAKQKPGGFWGKPEDFYIRAKYQGSVWTLILLASLGADGSDERVRAAGDFILAHSQEPTTGAFAYRSGPDGRGDANRVIPCLTANMAWSLIRLGRLDDPSVWRAVEWLGTYLRFDDGNTRPPKIWPYTVSERCWGRHTCTIGVVKGLKALAEVPPQKRTPLIEEAIERGQEFLLAHHLFKRSHDLSQVVRQQWLGLGFPRMANTDILEMVGTLARFGRRDSRMQEAIDLILAKQDSLGRWPLEASYNGRMQARIERVGEASKWVTLEVVETLKRLKLDL